MKHYISECDSSIIEKYKMCETCENREHIAWSSKCRMRRKKKQKTKRVRQIRMRLYFVSELQIILNVFRFVINSSTTSFTISITNSKIVFSKCKMIKIKKKKKWRFEIQHFFRIFIDFATNRVKKQYVKSSRQKLVSEQCDYEFEEHEKNITSQFDKSIQIRKQIIRECERVNFDKLNDRLWFFMKNTNVLIILQYNVRNEKIRTIISLFVDKNIQDYDVIAIQKF
jgi:hypothetical protein